MRENINALDIESSGFQGYPIQIGIIKENGETFESLIKPHEEWLEDLEWDYNAQAVHSLELDYVIKNGKSIDEVARKINRFVGEEDIFVDHPYDVMWLDLLFEFSEENREFNIFVLGKILPEDFIIHWDFMFYKMQKESGLTLHNALNDAKLIQKTYKAIALHF